MKDNGGRRYDELACARRRGSSDMRNSNYRQRVVAACRHASPNSRFRERKRMRRAMIIDHPPNKPPSVKPAVAPRRTGSRSEARPPPDWPEAAGGRAAVPEDRLENDFPMVYVDSISP
jgi:hypothetical protein